MNTAFRWPARAGFLLLAVLLSACAKKEYGASREIQFNQETLPDFVAAVSGFSIREDWGRWSDAAVAPTIKIQFKEPLPKNFLLTLKAQVVSDENASPKVRVGSFEEELFIQKIGQTVSVPVETNESVDTIEIIPVQPVRPKDLGVNDDIRQLGVGLYSLKIEY